MATIDLRCLNSDFSTTEITWGEILTAFSSRNSLDRVLQDLYNQELRKFTFSDGTVAQDVNAMPTATCPRPSRPPRRPRGTVANLLATKFNPPLWQIPEVYDV
jgi:hypothetical protein